MLEHLFKDLADINNIDEDIFGGIFQETISCHCGFEKKLAVQKLSEVLMIPLLGQSIQSCLTNYFYDEDINQECSNCQNSPCAKRMEIMIEPSTLIVQLKRYRYDRKESKIRKRQEEIRPSKKITLPSGSTYTISAIVNHIGNSADEGHYNLLIFDEKNNSFILLDDSVITDDVEITPQMNKLSYVMFYTKDK